MRVNFVYNLYTARNHWRLRFICAVTDRVIVLPIAFGSRVEISRFRELAWTSGCYRCDPIARGLTILYAGRIIVGGGRILAVS